jgi:hypothetical protein
MEILFALSLLGWTLFCVFGFLASAETSDPSDKFLWISGYTVLGLLSLLGAVALIFGKRDSDFDT